MSKTFAVTETPIYEPQYPYTQIAGQNDLFVGMDGNLVLAGITSSNDDQRNSVLYSCVNISLSILGEMVLQVNRGIPDFETVWNGTPNIAQWEIALRNALLAVDGVLEIIEIVITRETDKLLYTATILTRFGQGAINGFI